MLTGAKLGEAIKSALKRKDISNADLAREFKVKPPSVSGWITTGRISKPHFEKLRRLLSDVVGPEHWGLTPDAAGDVREAKPQPYHSPLSDDEWWLVAAYRKGKPSERTGMLAFARLVLPDRPTEVKRRTGT